MLEHFRGTHPEPLLLFYINHLAWELAGAEEPFVPSPSPGEDKKCENRGTVMRRTRFRQLDCMEGMGIDLLRSWPS